MVIHDSCGGRFNWDKLFKILSKSSPTSLYKFKFCPDRTYSEIIELKSLKSFFDNWKDRHSILLQLSNDYDNCYMKGEEKKKLEDLIEKYKAKGIIKKCYNSADVDTIHEDFEWS